MRAAGERCEDDWEGVIRRTVRSMLGYLGADWGASPMTGPPQERPALAQGVDA